MYKLNYRYGTRKRRYTQIFNSKIDMERYIESVKDKNLIVLDIEVINEKKMLIGYARVSTEDQSLDRQIDLLVDYGVDKRNIYQEKISGTKSYREQLDKMIDELQEGDTVIIADLTRISRSTKDLLNTIDRIKAKGASIKSIKDTWLDTSSDIHIIVFY